MKKRDEKNKNIMTKHSYYVRHFGYIFMVAVVSDICVQSVTLFLFLSFKISFFSNIFGQSYLVVFLSLSLLVYPTVVDTAANTY